MKKLLMIMAMVAVIAMAGAALATTNTFNNATLNADFATGTNWNPINPPWVGGSNLNLPGAAAPGNNLIVPAGFTPYRIMVFELGSGGTPPAGATASLSLSGDLTIDGTVGTRVGSMVVGRNVAATVTHSSGTLTVLQKHVHFGTLLVGRGASTTAGVGTYIMPSGSTGVVNPQSYLGVGEQYGVGANGGDGHLFDQQDGTVIVGDGSNPYIGTDYSRGDRMFVAAAADCQATYRISGGSLTVNASNNHGLQIGGSPAFDGAGVMNNWNNGGDGTFEVVGTGPSSITVNGELRIGGEIGTSVGKGNISFVMDAAGVTPITVNGGVWPTVTPDTTPGGPFSGDLLIDMSGLGGGVGDIPLILNDLVDPISGTFANAAEGATYGAYTLTYFGGDGNDLVLEGGTVIPEPAGLGLIGLALLAVRKRRNA